MFRETHLDAQSVHRFHRQSVAEQGVWIVVTETTNAFKALPFDELAPHDVAFGVNSDRHLDSSPHQGREIVAGAEANEVAISVDECAQHALAEHPFEKQEIVHRQAGDHPDPAVYYLLVDLLDLIPYALENLRVSHQSDRVVWLEGKYGAIVRSPCNRGLPEVHDARDSVDNLRRLNIGPTELVHCAFPFQNGIKPTTTKKARLRAAFLTIWS